MYLLPNLKRTLIPHLAAASHRNW